MPFILWLLSLAPGLDILTDGAPLKLLQPPCQRARSSGPRPARHGVWTVWAVEPGARIVGPIAWRGCAGRGRPVSPREHPPSDQDHGSRSLHDAAAGAERVVRDRSGCGDDICGGVNAEIKDLFAAGADILQIDEPYLQAEASCGETMGSPRSIARSRARAGLPAFTGCG